MDAPELADGSSLERLWTGAVWSEGPAWIATTGRLRWSDVVGNRILEFDAATGEVEEYARDVEYVNGRTLDLDGRVIQCSHGRRRVERDVGGVVAAIVDRFEGHRFNSPNDVVVAADEAIWFTDPPYGIRPDGREGHPGEQEYGGCFVFRFDESTGELSAEITDMEHPNGLAFSPDESLLYVA
ncbi:MAG: SMP-30/gluconolactonase/LRE family protein, partial [Actinomycetota bacterium]|nr:SMP-30/gluconolactonase/LRE family protein [Actinomycetota bacterium]